MAWSTQGPAYSQPASYTPTLSNNTNVSNNTAFWWRFGKWMYIEGNITWSGAGGGAAFSVALPLINGVQTTIDTAFLAGGSNTANATSSLLGDSEWFISGTGWKPTFPRLLTTSTVQFADNTQIIVGTGFATGAGFKYRLQLPITGWS